MKKRDLAALVMIGISAALLIGGCQQKGSTPGQPTRPTSSYSFDGSDQQAFLNQLSPEALKKFNELDDAGKKAVLEEVARDTNHDVNKAIDKQYSKMKK